MTLTEIDQYSFIINVVTFLFRKYNVLQRTHHLNIPYYVRDSFKREYQGSLHRLENSIEEEYIMVMKQNCVRERSYRK